MRTDRNINWYVLFVLLDRQEKLLNILRQHEIDAFAPTMEYYRRDIRSLTIKPMFPGYIFVRSEMSQIQFDDFLNRLGDQKRGMVKELKKDTVVSQERLQSEEGQDRTSPLLGVTRQRTSGALREEEIDFLTKILDETACMRMSYAVLRDGRAVVTDGPLAAYEGHIVKVDRHNRLAYLNLNYFDRQIQAGLTIGQNISQLQDDHIELKDGQDVSQLQAEQGDLIYGQNVLQLQDDHEEMMNGQGIPQLQNDRGEMINDKDISSLHRKCESMSLEEIDVAALRAAMMSDQNK